jgi:hypothetical protein
MGVMKSFVVQSLGGKKLNLFSQPASKTFATPEE